LSQWGSIEQELTINEPTSLRRASVSEEGEASRSVTGSGESIAKTDDLVKAGKKGGGFGEEGGAGDFGGEGGYGGDVGGGY